MEEKTVANGVIRLYLDSVESILGTNGARALLNYTNMTYLWENKPDYSFEKNYTDKEYGALIINLYQILGAGGAKAIFRQLGKTIAERTISLGIFDSVKELPPKERLKGAVDIYILASGRGVITLDESLLTFDNAPCATCHGITSEDPVCTIINGFLDTLAAWCGFKRARSREVLCKAMGDATCRYLMHLSE